MSLWIPGISHPQIPDTYQELDFDCPQLRSLAGFWAGNAANKGTLTDLSNNHNDGTLTGTILQSGWQNGPSINLDGVSGTYVDMGNIAALEATNNFSAFCWFRSLQSTSAIGSLLGKVTTSSSGWQLRISTSTSMRILCAFNTSSINTTITVPALTNVDWHFAGFTMNNKVAQLYLDGFPIGATATGSTTITTTAGKFTLGSLGGGGTQWFKGDMSLAFVLNDFLWPEEIQELYLTGCRQFFKKQNTYYGFLHTYAPSGLSDTATPADSLIKSISNRVFSDSTTPGSETLIRTQQSKPADSVAVIGAEYIVRSIGRALSDAPTWTDAIVRSINRALATSQSLSDALVRTPAKNLSDSETISDALAKTPTKKASDSITYGSDAIVRSLQSLLSDVQSLAESLSAGLNKSFTEAITLTEDMSRSITRLLTEIALSLADILIKQPTKKALDSLTYGGETLLRSVARALSDASSLTEIMRRSLQHLFSETESLTDDMSRLPVKKLSSGITYAADSLIKLPTKIAADTLTAGETFIRSLQKLLSDAPEVLDDLARSFLRPLSSGILLVSPGGNFQKTLTRLLSSTLSVPETFRRAMKSVMSDSVSVADGLGAVAALFLYDTLLQADDLRRDFFRNLLSIQFLDEEEWKRNLYKTIASSFSIADRVKRNMQSLMADALALILPGTHTPEESVQWNFGVPISVEDLITLYDNVKAFIFKENCSRLGPIVRPFSFDRIYSAIFADVVNQEEEAFTAYQVQVRPDGTQIIAQYAIDGVLQVSQGRRSVKGSGSTQTQRGVFWTSCSTLTQGTRFVANNPDSPRIMKRRLVVPLEGTVTEIKIPEGYPASGTLSVNDSIISLQPSNETESMGETFKFVLPEPMSFESLVYGVVEYTCYQVITVLTDGAQVQRPQRGYALGTVYRHDVTIRG